MRTAHGQGKFNGEYEMSGGKEYIPKLGREP